MPFTDKAANKTTLVVIWGRTFAFSYHLFLVLTAPLLSVLYLIVSSDPAAWQFLILLILVPIIKSCLSLNRLIKDDYREGAKFNEQLKNTSLTAFGFSIFFSLLLISVNL